MDNIRAIELLRQALTEVPHLKELRHGNQDFKLWRDKVRDIIKAALEPDDLKKFVSLWAITYVGSDGEYQNDYLGQLEDYENGLKSIIQKYEILEIESEPVIETGIPVSLVILYDALHLHPKVVKASKSCFVTGNYREAILNAFIRLIDYVKEITGLDLDGDDLMNKVFSFNYDKDLRRITKYPIIRINELKNSNDRNEQQGFMFLCKGAAGGIRNPKAHKLIPQSNPLHTLEYLAFASLLMRRIEEGKLELKETSS